MISHLKVKQWNNARFGLVLAGGGAKGAYEAGALRALEELRLRDKIRVISGTSVGALNAAAFTIRKNDFSVRVWEEIQFKKVIALPQKEERIKVRRLLGAIKNDSSVIRDWDKFLRYLSTTGKTLLDQKGIHAILNEEIHVDAIKKSNRDVYVCAYNIEKGYPEYIHLNTCSQQEMVQALLASAAIPYLFQPVVFRGQKYADGGINDPVYEKANSDNTPIAPLLKHCLDIVIVIYLRQDVQPLLQGDYTVRIVNIIPSKPLEQLKGSGTFNFSRSAIAEKMKLGYHDAMEKLAPWIMEYLEDA